MVQSFAEVSIQIYRSKTHHLKSEENVFDFPIGCILHFVLCFCHLDGSPKKLQNDFFVFDFPFDWSKQLIQHIPF